MPPPQNHLLRRQTETVVGFDGVRVDESRSAAAIEDHDPLLPELRKHGRRSAHVLDHIAHPLQEATVIQRGIGDIDSEGAQLTGLPTKSGRLSDDPDRHRSISGGHPAHGVAGDQCGPRPQPGRSQGGKHPGGPAADDGYIKLL